MDHPLRTVRIAAAQTPEFRQDLPAGLTWAEAAVAQADAEGAALMVFPEGFLQGYPTDEPAARTNALDLASPAFAAVLDRLARPDAMIVIGLIEADGRRLFNTAAVVHRGKVVGRYRKAHLLDGERLFEAGTDCPVFEVDGLRFGINICNDTNFPQAARRVAEQGASLIVCPANNMMRREAAQVWKDAHNRIRGERCRETGLWLVSADVTGERDGRIAWGPTAVLDPAGKVVAQLPLDRPGLLLFHMPGRT
ncbi:MAG: putative hydrolase [Caulobacter sp.]|nr:putative hydrolase [Caulobacter sp.]